MPSLPRSRLGDDLLVEAAWLGGLAQGAFLATMKSGHVGIFRRRGAARLPIQELLGSRPVDALLHEGEADGVAERGGRSFGETFTRVLPMELGK